MAVSGAGSGADFARLLAQVLAAEREQRWDEAVATYKSLQKLRPADHRLVVNAGQACWWADRPREARILYEQATGLAPLDPIPWLGLGNALRDLNCFEEADAAYARSWGLDHQPITAWNHSQLLIGLERYDQAYRLAEQRLLLPQLERYREGGLEALGQGEPPRRLHLWGEQGFGDAIQSLRWCVPLCSGSQEIVLELDGPLVALARLGLAWLPQPPQVWPQLPQAPPLAPGAGQASLLSLPHQLGGAPMGQVFEPTDRAGHWQGYLRSPTWPLGPAHGRPRVGLVWAAGRKVGDPFTAREYRKRSLPEAALGQLVGGLRRQDADLVALQVGPDHSLVQPWRDCFSAGMPQQADFGENARWIRELDLLISVDTASVHLAGALGHPCWALLPFSADPRWLRERRDSPWYPSLRLFRQPTSGAWEPVIEQILTAFKPWWHSVSG